MNDLKKLKSGIAIAGVLRVIVTLVHADTFGTGVNEFTIDFVNVGSPGNVDDAAYDDTAPDYSWPFGGVAYAFRMGVTEVPHDWITKATNLGLENVAAGPWGGNRPATNMTWYEAAAFVNWLNTTTGHHAAYNVNQTLTALVLWSAEDAWDNDPGAGVELEPYRHKDAYYFLPSVDEWYKSAFHKNDGATANYWDYAIGSDSIPTMAPTGGILPGSVVYIGLGNPGAPVDVNRAGGLSSYGTMGQNGNVDEYNERDPYDVNFAFEGHPVAGGNVTDSEFALRSSYRVVVTPNHSSGVVGFRVASVPEPSSALLMFGSGFMWLLKRHRRQVF